ncbi:MAG: tetratricopeptide repeat protein [Campylobacterota bacterium]|nr:tetratricopeptide repeat protein [Campylobacterota bacterium]
MDRVFLGEGFFIMMKNKFSVLSKILVIMIFLSIASFADNKQNINNEINNIKIELEKIKLIQQYENKDSEIDKIEKRVKDLETLLNKTNINNNSILKDLKKNDELIIRQDIRISDLNFYIGLYGVIVTILLLLASWGSYKLSSKESSELIKKWLDKKADKEFQPKVDEYLKQIEEKSNVLFEKIDDEHQSYMAKRNSDLIADLIAKEKLSDKDKKELNKDVNNIDKKKEDEYTFNDWNTKFLERYYADDYEEAIKFTEKAIQIFPNNSDLYNNMGIAYRKLGKYNEAIKAYEKAIEIKANDNIYYNMGIVYGELEEYDKAIEAFEKAIEINPKDDVYQNMGITYLKQKNKEKKAIQAFEEAIKLNSKEADSYLALGDIYGGLGEYANSLKYFEQAIEIDSKSIEYIQKNNLDTLRKWAESLENKVEKEDALQTIQKLEGK